MGNVQARTFLLLRCGARTPAAFKEHPISAVKGAMRSAIPWAGLRKGSVKSPDCWPAAGPRTSPRYRFSSLAAARRGATDSAHLVSRPQSRGGLPSRVSRRVAVARRISRAIGQLDGLGIAPVHGLLSDEYGQGHQIECGIFQCRDLGRRHRAARDHFEARKQYRGRLGQQFSAGVYRREWNEPGPLPATRPARSRPPAHPPLARRSM